MPPSRNLQSSDTSSNSLLPIFEHEASPLTCLLGVMLKLLSCQYAMTPSLAWTYIACTSVRGGLEFDESAIGIMAVSHGSDTAASTWDLRSQTEGLRSFWMMSPMPICGPSWRNPLQAISLWRDSTMCVTAS